MIRLPAFGGLCHLQSHGGKLYNNRLQPLFFFSFLWAISSFHARRIRSETDTLAECAAA